MADLKAPSKVEVSESTLATQILKMVRDPKTKPALMKALQEIDVKAGLTIPGKVPDLGLARLINELGAQPNVRNNNKVFIERMANRLLNLRQAGFDHVTYKANLKSLVSGEKYKAGVDEAAPVQRTDRAFVASTNEITTPPYVPEAGHDGPVTPVTTDQKFIASTEEIHTPLHSTKPGQDGPVIPVKTDPRFIASTEEVAPNRGSTAKDVARAVESGAKSPNWGLQKHPKLQHLLTSGAMPISAAELKNRTPALQTPAIKSDTPTLGL